jgi:hypothetical protein
LSKIDLFGKMWTATVLLPAVLVAAVAPPQVRVVALSPVWLLHRQKLLEKQQLEI